MSPSAEWESGVRRTAFDETARKGIANAEPGTAAQKGRPPDRPF